MAFKEYSLLQVGLQLEVPGLMTISFELHSSSQHGVKLERLSVAGADSSYLLAGLYAEWPHVLKVESAQARSSRSDRRFPN